MRDGSSGANFCAEQVSLPPERDAYLDGGRAVAVADRCLFLIELGTGEPVLFLHGIPTWSYVWRDVLPPVARERRCLAPDLLGFGHSAKPRGAHFGVTAQADLIAGLLDGLGIAEVALVAHDFGALVAAELTARQPARISGLVLSNTSLRRRSWRAGAPLSLLRLPLVGEAALWLARPWMLKVAMRRYVADRERLTGDVTAHYWWPFAHGYKRVLLALAREGWASGDAFHRWRQALRSYGGPALVVWGARDPTFGLDEAADVQGLLPQARLELLPGANHFLQEDQPETFARLITGFLAQGPK